MDKLPIVNVPYAPYNPRWKAVVVDGATTNIDELRLPPAVLAAEVLTLNLSTGMMRVRFVASQYNPVRLKYEFITVDVPAMYFFNEFAITKKAA